MPPFLLFPYPSLFPFIYVFILQKNILYSHFVSPITGRLELKIPWKNLYTQSVEATLDGVYLLIVPTASKIITHVPLNAYKDYDTQILRHYSVYQFQPF